MHRNENKYDQLFRDRLGDHSQPVRSDLWFRIHSGMMNLKPVRPVSRPSRVDFFSAGRQYLGFSATTFTATAAAILGITVGIIYFTHKAPATTREKSEAGKVVKVGESVTRKEGEDKVADGVQNGQELEKTAAQKERKEERVTEKEVGEEKKAEEREVAGVVSGEEKGVKEGKGIVAEGLLERRYGGKEKEVKETKIVEGEKKMGGREERKQWTVTLPAIAGTSSPAPISVSGRPIVVKSRVKGLNEANGLSLAKTARSGKAGNSGKTAKTDKMEKAGKTLPAQKLGYISLYASPDFPNHYYTWSYTAGVRLTWQFKPHWSFTAGLEYARVNVPTQAVPPTNSILNAFYFSNYEVPLLFGYRTTFRRSELTINAGAIVNLDFHPSTNGYIWNWPDRDSYGAVLGVDYSYSLGPHLGVFAEPYARFSISDYRMLIPAQRLSFGTLLGVRYRL